MEVRGVDRRKQKDVVAFASWRTPRVALALSCLMALGAHYGKHSLSALAPEMLSKMDLDRSQFGLMFSFQELPGIIFPLCAGALVSLISLPTAALLLTTLIFAGQSIVAIAAIVNSYWVLLLGRLVFGLGDGALVVLQGTIIGIYFTRHSEESNSLLSSEDDLTARELTLGISFAYGIMLFFSRLSTLLALALPALISAHCTGGFRCSLLVSSGVCGISFASGYVFYLVFKTSARQSTNVAVVPLHRDLWMRVRSLGTEFWLVIVVWIGTSSAFFSFIHFATDIFTRRYQFANVTAGYISALTLTFSATISPIFGYVLDRYGFRPAYLIFASLTMFFSMREFYLFESATTNSLFDTGLISFGFAFVPVTVLSCVTLVVPAEGLPAALGLLKCSENLGMAFTHYAAGFLVDHTTTYQSTFLLFMSLCFLAMVFSSVLLVVDFRTEGKLSRRDNVHE